jgi:cell division protein FtsW (lipid II flippase)
MSYGGSTIAMISMVMMIIEREEVVIMEVME